MVHLFQISCILDNMLDLLGFVIWRSLSLSLFNSYKMSSRLKAMDHTRRSNSSSDIICTCLCVWYWFYLRLWSLFSMPMGWCNTNLGTQTPCMVYSDVVVVPIIIYWILLKKLKILIDIDNIVMFFEIFVGSNSFENIVNLFVIV